MGIAFTHPPTDFRSAAVLLTTLRRLQQTAPPPKIDASPRRGKPAADPEFTMAFQPIVDIETREVFAYEALVRGVKGEGAGQILGAVSPENRFSFDRACRAKAIEIAARIGMTAKLSLNVLPNDMSRREACFQSAMEAAERWSFPTERLIFEVTEAERVNNLPELKKAFTAYKPHGFSCAIDDFGAGFAGFELFVALRPDIVKLDIELVRNIHIDEVRHAVVKGFTSTCGDLGIKLIAEGVETAHEARALRELGVTLFQGYLFARPVIETMPEVDWEWDKPV